MLPSLESFPYAVYYNAYEEKLQASSPAYPQVPMRQSDDQIKQLLCAEISADQEEQAL